jgi:hypothetical protein
VGGLIGIVGVDTTVNITNAYVAAEINAPTATNVNAFANDPYSLVTATGIYFDEDLVGTGDTYFPAASRTDDQFLQTFTFVGFNFDAVWGQGSNINHGYPFLRELKDYAELKVNLLPADAAVQTNGRWAVDGGVWYVSGEQRQFAPDTTATVSFGAVATYNAPANQSLYLASGTTTTATGVYRPAWMCLSGDGLSTSPFEIWNLDDLECFASLINDHNTDLIPDGSRTFAEAYYSVKANIDATQTGTSGNPHYNSGTGFKPAGLAQIHFLAHDYAKASPPTQTTVIFTHRSAH